MTLVLTIYLGQSADTQAIGYIYNMTISHVASMKFARQIVSSQ